MRVDGDSPGEESTGRQPRRIRPWSRATLQTVFYALVVGLLGNAAFGVVDERYRALLGYLSWSLVLVCGLLLMLSWLGLWLRDLWISLGLGVDLWKEFRETSAAVVIAALGVFAAHNLFGLPYPTLDDLKAFLSYFDIIHHPSLQTLAMVAVACWFVGTVFEDAFIGVGVAIIAVYLRLIGEPWITMRQGREAAQRACEERGLKWLEPVEATRRIGHYLFRTNAWKYKDNVWIDVDANNGHVLSLRTGPFGSIRVT